MMNSVPSPAIPSSLTTKLILASSSPYRKAQLVERFGLNLECLSPNIDESPLNGETPKATALRLSKAKALSIQERIPRNTSALIIAGDQTAEFQGLLLKKPGNHESATIQLREFSGQCITFYSGVCLLESPQSKAQVSCIETHVRMRTLSNKQIESYLRRDTPYDCVGAFKNETLGIALFESIESSDPSALTGLPLITLNSMLLNAGFDVLTMTEGAK